jgi:hypothetical protein
MLMLEKNKSYMDRACRYYEEQTYMYRRAMH